jgi:hypothetical protein
VEEASEAQKPNSEEFKSQIQDYLNSFPKKELEGSLFDSDALKVTINYQSVESIVLNDAQTLLIADLGNVTKNDKVAATKMVFYLHKDGIKQAKIISFENTIAFSDYNRTIKYMLNNENEAIIYSGKLSIYSVQGRFEFCGELEKGQLKAHSRAFRNKKSRTTARTSQYCTSWYRIDRMGEEIIAVTFLFKICEDSHDGDGGSSGDSEGTGDWPVFPPEPLDKALFTHLAPDGVVTVYRYNATRNFWEIRSISLPEVVIQNHPAHHQYLQDVQWPQHQQVVVGDEFTYHYNSFAGTWLVLPKIEIDITCAGLKKLVTSISTDTEFTAAVSSIKTASADTFEHSITLGTDGNGKITQAPINNGTSQYKVKVNTTWPRAFAAIHNHPTRTPMSAGDIYAAVQLNTKLPDFTTTFLVLPDGSMYALVVTDLKAASRFVETYPADINPPYSPEFPDFIFKQIEALKKEMGESIESRTTAIAFVLDKYNAGMKLLKQDANGDFNPIQTEETIQGGTKIYTPKQCN